MKKVFYALLVLMFLSCSNTTDTLIGVWEVDNTSDYLVFTKKGYFYASYSGALLDFKVDNNTLYLEGEKYSDIKIENKNLLNMESEDEIHTLTRIEDKPFWGKWIVKHSTVNGEDFYEIDNEIWTFSFEGFYTQAERNEKKYEYNSEKEVLNLDGEYFKIEKCTENNLVLTCNMSGFSGRQKIEVDLEKVSNTDLDNSLYSVKDAIAFVNRMGERKAKSTWENKASAAERALADSIRKADSLANVDARTSATALN